MDRDDVGGTSLWKHIFAFDDCCRETTTRCRGKRQTNQEIQVRRVRVVQLGAAVAMDAQMGEMAHGKSHDGGTIDLEHRDACNKVQNCTMNQNKRCSGLLRSFTSQASSWVVASWLCLDLDTRLGMSRTRDCDKGVARHNQTRTNSNSDESS